MPDSPNQPPWRNNPPPMTYDNGRRCKFYPNGTCRRGAECPFRHEHPQDGRNKGNPWNVWNAETSRAGSYHAPMIYGHGSDSRSRSGTREYRHERDNYWRERPHEQERRRGRSPERRESYWTPRGEDSNRRDNDREEQRRASRREEEHRKEDYNGEDRHRSERSAGAFVGNKTFENQNSHGIRGDYEKGSSDNGRWRADDSAKSTDDKTERGYYAVVEKKLSGQKREKLGNSTTDVRKDEKKDTPRGGQRPSAFIDKKPNAEKLEQTERPRPPTYSPTHPAYRQQQGQNQLPRREDERREPEQKQTNHGEPEQSQPPRPPQGQRQQPQQASSNIQSQVPQQMPSQPTTMHKQHPSLPPRPQPGQQTRVNPQQISTIHQASSKIEIQNKPPPRHDNPAKGPVRRGSGFLITEDVRRARSVEVKKIQAAEKAAEEVAEKYETDGRKKNVEGKKQDANNKTTNNKRTGEHAPKGHVGNGAPEFVDPGSLRIPSSVQPPKKPDNGGKGSQDAKVGNDARASSKHAENPTMAPSRPSKKAEKQRKDATDDKKKDDSKIKAPGTTPAKKTTIVKDEKVWTGPKTIRRKKFCNPCKWFQSDTCSGTMPCKECKRNMKIRGKKWSCVYDENFVKSGIMPEELRIKKVAQRHLDAAAARGEEITSTPSTKRKAISSPEGSRDRVRRPDKEPSTTSAMIANNKASLVKAETSSSSSKAIKSIKDLIDSLETSHAFYVKRSTAAAGAGSREYAKKTAAMFASRLNDKKLHVFEREEEEILATTNLGESGRKKMLELNLKDCLDAGDWFSVDVD